MAPRDSAGTASGPAPDRAGQATRNPALAMLRGAVVAAMVVGVNATVIAAVASGLDGLWGALLGLLMVITFSGLGLLVLHASRRSSPTTQLAVALASYTGRIGLFGLLLALALGSESLAENVDLTALGITALVVVAGWMAGEIWAWARLRVPIYDLDRQIDGQAPS
jgi:ATP synthase protein I